MNADELIADAIRNRTVPIRHSFYHDTTKRILDILIVLIGSIVALPILAIVAMLTFFDVGRPILFKQERIGLGGRPFTLYKFRNMTNKKDHRGVLLPPDQRVTAFGKLIRKTSLDELPQLWNILKGDMSVIGPRPLLPHYMPRYSDFHLQRHSVRPGLECPLYRKTDHAWTWDEQFDNDVWYVKNCCLKTDIHQFFRLIETLFNRKNNASRSHGERGAYREKEFGPIIFH